ncbi:response regulator, partial [Neorhizobium vignae]|uniref:response regulator n=1 Tax=Neorhizobium vignae TaxID=690585 RepID=UPI0009FF652D
MTEPSEAPLLLLVEDDPLVSLAVEEFLSGAGFAILVASSGQEAINLLEGDASLSAVVTDVRLGTGPSGWDVGHRARELTPSMPVIYMTGDSANLWSAHGVPGSIVIQKPFVEA